MLKVQYFPFIVLRDSWKRQHPNETEEGFLRGLFPEDSKEVVLGLGSKFIPALRQLAMVAMVVQLEEGRSYNPRSLVGKELQGEFGSVGVAFESCEWQEWRC